MLCRWAEGIVRDERMRGVAEAGTFDVHPFRGSHLVFGGRASMEAEGLLDGVVDAALESARRLRASGDEVDEEVLLADEISEETIGAAESFVGVPPLPPGG